MKQSLGASAVKLTISKMVTLVIAMIVAMLLSRFRTLEEYGTYSQIMLVINLVTVLFMLGLPNSINFFLPKLETAKEKREFLSNYYTINVLVSVLVSVVLFVCIPGIVIYFENPFIKEFAYFIVIYPWTKIIMSGIDNILIVMHKENLLIRFRIINSILLLFDVILVHLLSWSFQEYMILLVLSECLCMVGVYMISFKLVGGLTFHIDWKCITEIFKFTIPIGLASVVSTLCTEMDKLFIGYVFDTEELAVYANAAKELPVTIVATSIAAVVLPAVVKLVKKEKNKDAIELWKHSVVLSYIFICFIAIGVITYAEDVISILYSSKYVSGVSVFRVYALMLLFRCTYFGTLLNAKGKTKFIFHASLMSLVLNVILNFVCYNLLGYIGPAVASFLSMLLVLLVQLGYTAKIYSVKYRFVFPWGKMGVITLINVLMGMGFRMLKNCFALDTLVGSEVESIILAVVWGMLYVILMYKLIRKEWNSFSVVDE